MRRLADQHETYEHRDVQQAEAKEIARRLAVSIPVEPPSKVAAVCVNRQRIQSKGQAREVYYRCQSA